MDKLLKGSLALTFVGALMVVSTSPKSAQEMVNGLFDQVVKSRSMTLVSQGFVEKTKLPTGELTLSDFHDYYGYMPNVMTFLR